MSEPVRIIVYGMPAPAGSKRGFYNKKTSRVIVTDDSKRSRPWKAQIADAAAEAMGGRDLFREALLFECVFYVPRPKGHYRTGKNAALLRPSAPTFPTSKPDLLKLARAAEDSLSGVVYYDDALIVVELLRKRYGEPARVEILVAPAEVPLALSA